MFPHLKPSTSHSRRARMLGLFGCVVLCLILWHYLSRPAKIDLLVDTDIPVPSTVLLSTLLSVSIDAVQTAGHTVMQVRNSGNLSLSSKGKTEEGKDDPLTIADVQSHQIIMRKLRALNRKLFIRSEEHADIDADPVPIDTTLLRWQLSKVEGALDRVVDIDTLTIWVDPLDATQEYSEGLLEYVTVMICLVEGTTPLAGVIHSPHTQRTAWGIADPAIRAHGGFDFVTEPPVPRESTMIISRSHPGAVRELQQTLHMDKVVAAGGSGYKALQVLEGKADAYIHRTRIKKWDFCAPDALFRSVDGVLTDWQGGEFDYGREVTEVNKGGLVGTRMKQEAEKLLKTLSKTPL